MMNDAAKVLKQLTAEFSNENNITQIPTVEKSMFDSALFSVPPDLMVNGIPVGDAINLAKHLSIADKTHPCVPVGGKARKPRNVFDNLFDPTYAQSRIRGPDGEDSDALEIICCGEEWQLSLVGCFFMVLKWSEIIELIERDTSITSSPVFNTIQKLLKATVVTHEELNDEILRKYKEIIDTAADESSTYQLGHTFSSCNRVVGVNGDDNSYNRVMTSLKFLFELLRKFGFEIEISCFDRTKCNIHLLKGPDGNEINKFIWVGFAATNADDDSHVTFQWGIDSSRGYSVGPPGMVDVAIWICAPPSAASAGGAMERILTQLHEIQDIDGVLSKEGIGFLVLNMSGNPVCAPHNVFNCCIGRSLAKPCEINVYKQKRLQTDYYDFNGPSNERTLKVAEKNLFSLSQRELRKETDRRGRNKGLVADDKISHCQNLIAFDRHKDDWKPKHYGQVQYSFGNSIGSNHTCIVNIKNVDLQPQGPRTEENQRRSKVQMIRRGYMLCMGLVDRLPNIAMGEEERLISIDRNPASSLGGAVFDKMPFSTGDNRG